MGTPPALHTPLRRRDEATHQTKQPIRRSNPSDEATHLVSSSNRFSVGRGGFVISRLAPIILTSNSCDFLLARFDFAFDAAFDGLCFSGEDTDTDPDPPPPPPPPLPVLLVDPMLLLLLLLLLPRSVVDEFLIVAFASPARMCLRCAFGGMMPKRHGGLFWPQLALSTRLCLEGVGERERRREMG